MKTPAPSPYPVLDNRPIDQWKVSELKEELKRRKLITRGLKEDLVRRLDDALRSEMDVATVEANDDNGVQSSEADSVVTEAPVAVLGAPVVSIEDPVILTEDPVAVTGEPIGVSGEPVGTTEEPVAKAAEAIAQTVEPVTVVADLGVVASGIAEEAVVTDDLNAIPMEFEFKDSAEKLGQGKSFEEKEPRIVNVQASGVGLEISTDAPVVSEREAKSDGLSWGNGPGLEDGKSETVNGDSRAQQHSEDIMPPLEDVKLNSSDSISQVSEVSSSLGFPVKSNNSISTDSLSINEKNDLKDNIIADNVKLESDVKPEMLQPSSSDLVADGCRSHPTDVDEPHENKVSVEETDNTVANVDISQKNSSADLGSPEKLNLDRSSCDDSMEEDALESKQIDSNYNAEEVEGKTEKIEVTIVKGESAVATMDTDLPLEKKGIHDEINVLAAASDKRKLSDQEAALNNKPAKRQHRWKTESNSVSALQTLDIPPEASSKDVLSPATPKRGFSRSDSIVASEPPKEREVPPSTKPATTSLRIDRFLRPFTLKAVQELLGKTGKVTIFWMDHIKTHCYVTYSSVEEAMETRNAVYNLQWPPNGGRQLVAEFVEPGEVKLRAEPPAHQPPVQPVASDPIKAPEPPVVSQPSPRQQNLRQQLAQQPSLPPPPPLPDQGPVKDLALPPPPPRKEKVDAPIVTLDDLFRKTKATPRIYYLPLSEERVSALLEERRKKANQ